jgi:hypothetical protein
MKGRAEDNIKQCLRKGNLSSSQEIPEVRRIPSLIPDRFCRYAPLLPLSIIIRKMFVSYAIQICLACGELPTPLETAKPVRSPKFWSSHGGDGIGSAAWNQL